MTDWAGELRAYRSRTGIKQEALAAQLKISQAFVSRLEAGRVEPRDDVLLRIRSLVENPGNRPVLDHVLMSVRRSPHVICVIQPGAENFRYVALSRGFLRHPQFATAAEGQEFRKEAAPDGTALIGRILRSGAFEGDVASIDVIWRAEIDGFRNFWQSINTPMRAGDGGWYLHCAMSQLNDVEFGALQAQRDTDVVVHRFQ